MTLPEPQPTPPKARRTGPVLALCFGIAAFGIVSGLYGMQGQRRNGESAPAGQCKAAQATAQRIVPLIRGEVAGLQANATPRPLVNISFAKPDGTPTDLAAFRGKAVLVNLWATWCAPCRQEMPALDTLQKTLGGKDFEVVAINIDTRNLEKPKQFLTETGVTALAYYSDSSANVFADLKKVGKAFGMPTTLLVDKEGCELASLAGPAEWASADALAVIRAALAP